MSKYISLWRPFSNYYRRVDGVFVRSGYLVLSNSHELHYFSLQLKPTGRQSAGAWLLPGLPGKLGIATDYHMKCIKLLLNRKKCVCMCVCVCTCMCMHVPMKVRSQHQVSPSLFSLLFETGSLWTGAHWFVWAVLGTLGTLDLRP